jgi:flavin reductase (DIM6/NTAB) family NADH-FMN oxidoreductase RutF
METTNHININEINFDQLFKQISPDEVCDNNNIFTLVGKDLYVITAGKEDHYNSMTGSGGGFGLFFRKPTTWCLLRTDRYTLELIEEEQTYTLSYFPDEYKKQIMFLGNKSGRDSEKMKEVELTSVRTPSGDISFIEAKLIIECKLTALTTVDPNDLYSQEAKDFTKEEYKDANHYRKLAFGEITSVWVKR